jgi:hypothetical protein
MLRFDTGQTVAWFAGLMQLNTATEQDRIIQTFKTGGHHDNAS